MAVGLHPSLDLNQRALNATQSGLESAQAPKVGELAPSGNDFANHVARAKASSGAVAVKAQRTPLSGGQASEAIARAYTQLTGKEPSKGTLAILTSQWSLETGQGQRMYNYNFAGLKGRGPEGFTAVMTTREGYGQNERTIQDGFRAYSDADSGAKDYVSLLQRKYSSALAAAEAEDPGSFASELKAGGYYTANETDYANAVTRLANRAMAMGFDALGGDSGPTANPGSVVPYFQTPARNVLANNGLNGVNGGQSPGALAFGSHANLASRSFALDPSSALAGLGLTPGDGRAPTYTPSQTADLLTDEISRAALRIAARFGA